MRNTQPAHKPTSRARKQLDAHYEHISKIILSRQHPISGLLPASTAINAHGDYTHAWVRDNVYSVLAVWGLGLAYRKLPRENNPAFLLEHSTVKLMRGLLFAMMKQARKVERFKYTQATEDCLHAKYDTLSGDAVVGDSEWGHLQLDATSLYLLMLAQMTASGLHIIFTLDEVDFVQNLVHYIGQAYRTPDYGIWERGHKINHGLTELNASSIGMAKAALEALRDFNLFGRDGGESSVIRVVEDEIAAARAALESLLPRESGSKEVDAALLSIVGFPAFAVEDRELAKLTRNNVISKLKGRYGCKRFLLDGHQTALEDTNRLHYEPSELKRFEHIESEWPLFFTYLLLDELFAGNPRQANEYEALMQTLLIERDGHQLVPELYFVPSGCVDQEKAEPHSQTRLPNENVPLIWAQSLYWLGLIIQDGLLSVADVDPLGRRFRLGYTRKVAIHCLLLAENEHVQHLLQQQGVDVETVDQVKPVNIRRASEFAEVSRLFGKNSKLNLSGRPAERVNNLAISQVFELNGTLVLFLPSFFDQRDFYLAQDNHLLVEQFKSELAYHRHHWQQPGNPLITLLITESMLSNGGQEIILELIGELRLGHCNSADVRMGFLTQLMDKTSKQRINDLPELRFSHPPMHNETISAFVLRYDQKTTAPLAVFEEQKWDLEGNADQLLQRLESSGNLYEHIAILRRLRQLLGAKHVVRFAATGTAFSIEFLLEDLYTLASQHHVFGVVRQAAGLLHKHAVNFENAVGEIMLRQRRIAIGRAYSSASVITKPLTAQELLAHIATYCGDDEREQILTQEILLYLGMLIKTEPSLFDKMLTLRIGHILLLMTSQAARRHRVTQADAFRLLLDCSPHILLGKLRAILAGYQRETKKLIHLESLHQKDGSGQLTWVRFSVQDDPYEMESGTTNWRTWREHQGVVSRLPDEFYANVWNILGHCKGIVIGDKLNLRNRLESNLRLETTALEKNFALHVEHLLNKIHAPEYRQLVIEALTALSAIFHANPNLVLDDYLVLDVLIGHAVRLAWLNLHPNFKTGYDQNRTAAWESIYETTPHQTANAVMAALDFLLVN